MNNKWIIPLLLLVTIILGVIYYTGRHKIRTNLTHQLIDEEKKAVAVAALASKKSIAVIHNRPKLIDLPGIQVGVTITSDTLDLLKNREQQDMIAIEDCQVVVKAQATVIKTQDEYIVRLEHKVLIWRIISGVIVIIAIILL